MEDRGMNGVCGYRGRDPTSPAKSRHEAEFVRGPTHVTRASAPDPNPSRKHSMVGHSIHMVGHSMVDAGRTPLAIAATTSRDPPRSPTDPRATRGSRRVITFRGLLLFR